MVAPNLYGDILSYMSIYLIDVKRNLISLVHVQRRRCGSGRLPGPSTFHQRR